MSKWRISDGLIIRPNNMTLLCYDYLPPPGRGAKFRFLEDMRRIVACLNYCRGLKTTEIEGYLRMGCRAKDAIRSKPL